MTASRSHPLATSDRLRSVTRALAVLDVLAACPEGQTAKGVAAALDLALPTTYHLLNTLVAAGYAARDPDSRLFTLGPGISHLHQSYLSRARPTPAVRPFLQALHETTGATAYIMRLLGDEAVAVDLISGREPPSIGVGYVGYALPAHLIASGLVLLAWASPSRRHAYATGRYGHFAGTFPPVDAARLEADVARIRADGYAIDRGWTNPEVWCAAAPILIAGAAPEALTIIASRDRFLREEAALITALQALATAAGIVASAGLNPGGTPAPALSQDVAEATKYALEVPL